LFQDVFVGAGKWFQAPNESASARGKLRPLGYYQCVPNMGQEAARSLRYGFDFLPGRAAKRNGHSANRGRKSGYYQYARGPVQILRTCQTGERSDSKSLDRSALAGQA
jgi:hypothetical protein